MLWVHLGVGAWVPSPGWHEWLNTTQRHNNTEQHTSTLSHVMMLTTNNDLTVDWNTSMLLALLTHGQVGSCEHSVQCCVDCQLSSCSVNALMFVVDSQVCHVALTTV